ncbi:MAG: UDP-N-acetylmuramoyl-L-alanyl-D-glutamate--2,6-diaminopimelate ligase [Nocardioidaceae bacterium]
MTVDERPRRVVPVSLSALATVAGAGEPSRDVELTGVSMRSGSVRPGDLYAALPGATTHGARFAEQAGASGARAILTDEDGVELARAADLPTLVVERPRAVLGRVAAAVYGSPAEAVTLVGVTGTQGKTTTTQLLSRGLAAAGRRTAVIGTMGSWVGGKRVSTSLTTPEAPDLHALFAVMRERAVEVCAVEVSSHALVMGRVDGVRFDVAVFLNFGRDHLDFHRDVDDYFEAKAGLFSSGRTRRALLNADDPSVAALGKRLDVPVRTFSPSGEVADWRCREVRLRADGSDFVLAGPDDVETAVSISLAGDFNVANAGAALAAVGEVGLEVGAAAAGIARVEAVSGRLERIDVGQSFAVVVDYAHKPDAVTAALRALRAVTPGRLLVVLGAGGDRDPGKRELMGAAAVRLADLVVVTDDNPRTEDPAQIRAALLAGARAAAGPTVEIREVGDRRAAIERAIRAARPGDTVLVAGKGHETGQDVAGRVLPFDDRVVVREILRAPAGTGAGS